MFTPIDPKPLNIVSNDRDVLRDLFIYLGYIRERSVKRMARDNRIPRADSVRIAKLMDDPELVQVAQETGGAAWIDFIDELAYDLDLVDYDTEGKYRGYSSQEPTYLENFIEVDDKNYDKFLSLAPAAQEKQIFEMLVKFQSVGKNAKNELQHDTVLAGLGLMNTYHSHLENVKFPQVRQFLLKLLENCVPGTWYSTESLVAYLKASHPYFLLAKDLPQKDRWGAPMMRYSGFREGEDYWSSKSTIPDDAPDVFERVEGRYVERFLEYVPLVMRFVDVAYDPEPYTGPKPSRGLLKAFCVRERFLRLMSGNALTPKVTIQPNFDVVIESDFYPAGVIQQIAALGEQMSNPNTGHGAYVGIFQLKKASVAAALVRHPDLDVIALLKNMSGRDLPPNVQIELDEWAGHADQFTLYEGFALLETADFPRELENFTAEKIAPTFTLVRNPVKVSSTLETIGRVPLRVEHLAGEFSLLPESAASLFPKELAWDDTRKTARQVRISRLVTISYQFPDDESFEAIKKMLAELRCPFQADPKARMISIQQKEQPRFDEALSRLAGEFLMEIE